MVGRRIKHYEIEAELGQGGMGVVYRAKDTVLERTVALKFLPPMFAKDDDARKRFVHEAKAVSALDHPNVAVVHEIGEGDDGEMFIVMAFYQGQTLEDVIADGPVDLDETVQYMLEAAKGLAAAHGKGIIHRDIKPGNIMVTETGLLKILDFGLAKVQDVTMTMGAMSLGTLAYMSPEQAQGQPVDHRTDLWALGVVFYEMLAGKRPFDGPYDAAILYAAANEAHTSVSAWRTDAPDHLVAIVDKLLQKQPENRYQSADELIADLQSATAPPPSVIQPVQAAEAPATTSTATAPVAESAIQEPVVQASGGMSMQKALWIVILAVVVIGTVVTMWISMQGPADPATQTATLAKSAQEYVDEGIAYLNEGQETLAWGVHRMELIEWSGSRFGAVLWVGAGGFVALAGVWSFARARTTVNPHRPGNTSSLVTSGIYRVTRNPMYLGMLMVLIGWAVYLGGALPLVVTSVFVPFMNRFQIQPEERVMKKLFGEAFDQYASAVRRWI